MARKDFERRKTTPHGIINEIQQTLWNLTYYYLWTAREGDSKREYERILTNPTKETAGITTYLDIDL